MQTFTFRTSVLETNGRANDALVISKCTFDEALRKNILNMPVERVFVAAEALPLFFEETFNKTKQKKKYLTIGVFQKMSSEKWYKISSVQKAYYMQNQINDW
jgi:hypothetical protein